MTITCTSSACSDILVASNRFMQFFIRTFDLPARDFGLAVSALLHSEDASMEFKVGDTVYTIYKGDPFFDCPEK